MAQDSKMEHNSGVENSATADATVAHRAADWLRPVLAGSSAAGSSGALLHLGHCSSGALFIWGTVHLGHCSSGALVHLGRTVSAWEGTPADEPALFIWGTVHLGRTVSAWEGTPQTNLHCSSGALFIWGRRTFPCRDCACQRLGLLTSHALLCS